MNFSYKLLIAFFPFVSNFLLSYEDQNYGCIQALNKIEPYKVLIEELRDEYSQEESKEKIINGFDFFQQESLTSFQLGKYSEGLKASIQSSLYADSYETPLFKGYTGIAYSRAGINLLKLGHIKASKACHEESYKILSNSNNKAFLSSLAWEEINLGKLYQKINEDKKSLDFFKKAKRNFYVLRERSDSKNFYKYTNYYLNSLAELSSFYLEKGNFYEANAFMQEYQGINDDFKNIYRIYEAYAREVFSRVYLSFNKIDLAEEQIIIAKDLLKDLPHYYLHPLLDLTYSEIYKQRGNLNSALKYSLRGLNFIEKSRKEGYDQLASYNSLESEIEAIYENYYTLVYENLNSKASKELIENSFIKLQRMDLAKFKEKLKFLNEEKENIIDESDKELAQQITKKIDECNSIHLEKSKLYEKLSSELSFLDQQLQEKEKESRICFNQYEALINKKEWVNPKIRAFMDPEEVELKKLQENLNDGEGLVAFFFHSSNSFVWYIDKTSVQFHKINVPLISLNKLKDNLKNTLSINRLGKIEPFDQVSSFKLYSSILSPVLDDLETTDTLIFIRNDFFNGIPLSVLITSLSEYTKPQWLFERFDINNIHTVSYLRKRKNISEIGSFYGFGDPLPKDNLERLDNAEEELKSLSKGFQSPWQNVFLRERANKEELSNISFNNGILAFATHAVTPFQIPLVEEPSLLLTEWLSATEIAFNFDINASIVLMSACETAWTNSDYKDSILDLPSAFMLSGAQSVVVTSWSIEDQATKDIMVEAADFIYTNPYAENLFSKALRHGMRKYIEENEMEKYRGISKTHPFFWAPFELIGAPN